MNELIKVNYDTQTVSARDLHKTVGSTERFSSWFERQLQFGFVENEDYTTVKVLTKVQNNGGVQQRELTDHNLTVDMAKHICMVQKNEKAKEVRQYLIDLEKAWNTPEQVMARALRLADKTIDSLKDRCKFLGGQILEQKKVIDEMQPKANYVDTILKSKSTVLVTQIAQDYGMSAKALNKKLKDLGVQHKVGGQWILYSKYQGCGYVHSSTIDITRSNGQPDVVMQTEWTQKGRLFLYDLLKNNDIYPLIEQV